MAAYSRIFPFLILFVRLFKNSLPIVSFTSWDETLMACASNHSSSVFVIFVHATVCSCQLLSIPPTEVSGSHVTELLVSVCVPAGLYDSREGCTQTRETTCSAR